MNEQTNISSGAAGMRRYDSFSSLLRDIQADAANNDHVRGICCAGQRRLWQLLRFVLEKNKKNEHSRLQRLRMRRLLLSHRRVLSLRWPASQARQIYTAASEGDTALLCQLLSDDRAATAGGINYIDAEGFTALHMAVKDSNVECVELLLSPQFPGHLHHTKARRRCTSCRPRFRARAAAGDRSSPV